ncbi:uncharacterized protein EI90DRAFT_3021046 [Cantharellus anzutake]|uniref:uncharacterized protein n=1 Tax=Cantharellus anzutake TaxID=1750568 RepID=UPI00190454C4|nr:uncharacterized protein EI90DRAFT_3021046 [Cantharellus anzutake]KAF8318324.1 hypothetical protein EI90DRAFT_3021046 [Cantharellus anzutake]
MVLNTIWEMLRQAFEAIKGALAKVKELLALRKSIELLGRILHAVGVVIVEEIESLMERIHNCHTPLDWARFTCELLLIYVAPTVIVVRRKDCHCRKHDGVGRWHHASARPWPLLGRKAGYQPLSQNTPEFCQQFW